MKRPNYDTMTPQEILAKLKHHECLEDEAKEASSQKKSIALKALMVETRRKMYMIHQVMKNKNKISMRKKHSWLETIEST
jgi:hypothetical protein